MAHPTHRLSERAARLSVAGDPVDDPEAPATVPRRQLRRQAPVLRGLQRTNPARELVDAVVVRELAPVDHAAQRDPGGALGDPETGAPLDDPGARQAGRVHAEEQAADHRPGVERPVEQLDLARPRLHYELDSSVFEV